MPASTASARPALEQRRVPLAAHRALRGPLWGSAAAARYLSVAAAAPRRRSRRAPTRASVEQLPSRASSPPPRLLVGGAAGRRRDASLVELPPPRVPLVSFCRIRGGPPSKLSSKPCSEWSRARQNPGCPPVAAPGSRRRGTEARPAPRAPAAAPGSRRRGGGRRGTQGTGYLGYWIVSRLWLHWIMDHLGTSTVSAMRGWTAMRFAAV